MPSLRVVMVHLTSQAVAGVYNYFGIGAYDWNPNYAITYARNRGWTTPKGIIGGAFVRQGFISKGQIHFIVCVGTLDIQVIINMQLMYAGHKFKRQL